MTRLTSPQLDSLNLLWQSVVLSGYDVVFNDARGYSKTETCVELLRKVFEKVTSCSN